ncbi:MAG TPA: tetratricopeptide repeat protein, partial [Acidobacteriota bacterium]|nr:tetratricopeptide repeat protein [Acidobacteriota bacterium]
DEAVLIESGKRDSRFFTSGWYRAVQTAGGPLRITNGTNAVLSVPMKREKEYNLILRAYPVFEKPSNPSAISVSVNSQPAGKLELNEPAKSAYVLKLPKGVVKDGLNRIQFHRIDPNSTDIAVQYFKIQSLEAFQHAMEKYSNNELDEAIRFFELSLEQNKKRRAALYYLGLSYLKKGQPDKAIAYFTESLSQFRGNTDVLEARGEAYLQLKKYDAAIRDLTKVLKNEPDNENAQRLLLTARESSRKNDLTHQ